MDLTMSADQRDLRAGLRDYLQGTWTPDRLRAAAETPALDRGDWSGLAGLGVFGLTVPEAAGGMGLGLVDAAIVFEELGRALVPGPLVATFLAAGPVPGADDGGAVVTSLDLRDPVLVAEHLDSATHVVAVGDDGLHLWPAEALVAEPAPAPLDPLTPVSRVKTPPVAGERIGSAADAAGWRLRGAVLTSALQVGVAQGALDLAVRYAGERTQFGRVIGSFQAVKHLLADSLVRVDLARAAVWAAALTVDDPEAGDPGEAASAAKVLADDAASQGGRCCVQVHGGMGFTWEVLAHLYLKRAWLQETCFGQADEHARHLAEAL
ncbi:Acyl-CoA dehydrogenase, N-terminal domain [Thermomonospora echinospora]|uniref:Acyl-CoA dehydrogenase, N-terminal domain n=1 Tax=Thermomonospora echinospora TaxID=1992 RepID=A0A1H5T8T4_9ACTN|nr:acyl-CoA dehydrogenase family protein [Thermomonospora echinospora]SEF59164.1 Acyl-CoA dehydrogenase, N-terminal domain [Thermomonospora echinospora]